jgi:hypothetical protein
MYDKREISRRKLKCPDIALQKAYCGVIGQVGRFQGEGCRVTAEHMNLCAQIQPVTNKNKTLEQPAAEEAAPARNEYILPSHFFPEVWGVIQDMFQVLILYAV